MYHSKIHMHFMSWLKTEVTQSMDIFLPKVLQFLIHTQVYVAVGSGHYCRHYQAQDPFFFLPVPISYRGCPVVQKAVPIHCLVFISWKLSKYAQQHTCGFPWISNFRPHSLDVCGVVVVVVYHGSHAFQPPILFFANMLVALAFSVFGNQLTGFCKEPSG